jgi:hypothetical protein
MICMNIIKHVSQVVWTMCQSHTWQRDSYNILNKIGDTPHLNSLISYVATYQILWASNNQQLNRIHAAKTQYTNHDNNNLREQSSYPHTLAWVFKRKVLAFLECEK